MPEPVKGPLEQPEIEVTQIPTQSSGPQDGTSPSIPSASPTGSTLLEVGSTLGPYRLDAKLGEGGMGAVYKALHTRLKKFVAVKVLPPHLTQNADSLARFDREMQTVGELSHPNIVQAHNAGEISGTRYLAMEYVEGSDLAKLVNDHGPFSVVKACKAVQALAAVGNNRQLLFRDGEAKPLRQNVSTKCFHPAFQSTGASDFTIHRFLIRALTNKERIRLDFSKASAVEPVSTEHTTAIGTVWGG